MTGYNTKSVAQIIGLSSRQIDYWDSTHFIKPSVSEASGHGSTRLYSFNDLVQFRVAKSLLDNGISLQQIREAVIYLKTHMPEIDAPLSELKFITNGETIFVITKDTKKIIDTLRSGQVVFSIALGEIVEELRGDILSLDAMKEYKYKVKVKGKDVKVLSHKNPVTGKYQITCPLYSEISAEGDTLEESLQMMKMIISQQDDSSTNKNRGVARK